MERLVRRDCQMKLLSLAREYQRQLHRKHGTICLVGAVESHDDSPGTARRVARAMEMEMEWQCGVCCLLVVKQTGQ